MYGHSAQQRRLLPTCTQDLITGHWRLAMAEIQEKHSSAGLHAQQITVCTHEVCSVCSIADLTCCHVHLRQTPPCQMADCQRLQAGCRCLCAAQLQGWSGCLQRPCNRILPRQPQLLLPTLVVSTRLGCHWGQS